MIVLLVLDHQLTCAGAGDYASSTAQVTIPSTKPIRLRSSAVVPKVLEAAHQQLRLALGAFDDHYALLADEFCKER